MLQVALSGSLEDSNLANRKDHKEQLRRCQKRTMSTLGLETIIVIFCNECKWFFSSLSQDLPEGKLKTFGLILFAEGIRSTIKKSKQDKKNHKLYSLRRKKYTRKCNVAAKYCAQRNK